MLSVCYVSTYPPMHCGIANYTLNLIQALVGTAPVRVTVITEKIGQRCVHRGIEYIPSFNRDVDYVQDILKPMAKTNPDIVHIQHDYSVYGFDQRFFNLLEKIRSSTIVTMHEVHTPETTEKITYGIENLARRHAELGKHTKRIITHSDTMKEWLVKYGVKPSKIEVIPHGTTIFQRTPRAEAKKRWGFSETDKIILSLGFIRRSKNDRLLIETLPDLVEEIPNVRLLLVGSLHPYSSQEDMEELRLRSSIVRRLGLDQYVRLIERYLSDEEILSILGCADVLVYLHDKQYVEVSGALHLGIGAGKPIVATAVPRFEEVQKFSPETVLVPDDRRRLVETVAKILTDDDFASDLAKRTAAYARQTSWTKVAREHYRVYQEILKQDVHDR